MKRGSALLIVLGMLSFMLFSGLAFSVYMRQARLPSSFIRRTAVSRQLAKAALSEAMAEINDCIGNDPHPGVFDPGSGEDFSTSDGRSNAYHYNTFYRRVFLGSGADTGLYRSNRENALRRLLVDNLSDNIDDQTVATLTLEGLTYLPPCLINEARVYSRRTPTAKWTPFAFEAGRYAYTAIDVSDFFDVNRVPANAHRSSASSSRITLAHAFEDGEHTGSGGAAAGTYDNRAVGQQSKQYPFISLCDWNLAMNQTKLGPTYASPVMDYIRRSESEPCAIIASDDEADPKVSAYRAMTFVTDSKFTEDASGKKDIEEEQYQPFTTDELKADSAKNLSTYLTSPPAVWNDHYLKFLSRLGMCALADYLDEDSVPMSLVIPTCEKIPMLCAIRPNIEELTLKIVKAGNPENKSELLGPNGSGKPNEDPALKKREVSCWYTYEIDGKGLNARMAAIDAMALFPFRHNEDKASYDVDGQVALFFTKSGEDVPLVFKDGRNTTGLVMDRDPATSFSDTGILKFQIGKSALMISGNGSSTDADTKFVKKEKDLWIRDFGSTATYLPMNNDPSKPASKACVARVLRQWEQTREELPDGTMSEWTPKQPPDKAKIVKAETGFGIIGGDGKAIPSDIRELIEKGVQLELNLAVWLRIKEKSGRGKTVDMVPAWVNDDTKQGLGGASGGGRTTSVYQRIGGDTMRIMRFKFRTNNDPKVLSLSLASLDAEPEKVLSVDSSTLVCSDPRFNHNPYNWFPVNEPDVKQAWESNMNCTGDGRDGDYFMFVSNQGYLQSIYELAFIPRTTDPHDDLLNADELCGDLRTQANYGYSPDYPANFGACINANNMWKTYRPYRVGDYRADDFEQMGLTSGANGQKVNPYSDSLAVISTAFANTPVDWRAASTNYQNQASIGTGYTLGKVDDFNQDYAWNAYNVDSKLPWFEGVMRLARRFQNEMSTCSTIDEWEDVYGALWDAGATDPTRLMGTEIEEGNFSVADKKFLYGYWHDCFGVQQQLFLIFVRAEPMMMGGGVAGVAPPQLAARAVALVWRDPRPTLIDTETKKAKPHAMRVLFYHPLD